ncbi:MAG: MFS transporter [Streptosporangiaceae bacterium]
MAFAAVVSFMGIGLVDPILPLLRTQLHATEAQVSLLFTSYFLVTAIFMLIAGWVSSRIGAKRTLLAGLTMIVIFSALAGLSSGVTGIVWFRGGWGIGNALFISTALATIVGAASGGFGAAIMLYEAALGLGIALGPLIGGELGGISWRGPFFGVTALMAIAFLLVSTLLAPTPKPSARASLADPFRALTHRGLLTVAIVALLYNWAFFTILGYAPYPMRVSVHALGFIYTGWGILVAIFAVFVAPRLQRAIGTVVSLYVSLALMCADLLAIAIWTNDRTVLIVCVIASGAFIGLNNTLVTATSMTVSTAPRPTASAAYSFVRFFGAGLAPYVASTLAAHVGDHVPFYVGAATIAASIPVLATTHRLILRAEQRVATESARVPSPPRVPRSVAPAAVARPEPSPDARRPVVIAVGPGPQADEVVAGGATLAQALDYPVEILHVAEIDIAMDEGIATEDSERAAAALREGVEQVARRGIPVTGHLLEVVGDHADVGRCIAEFADQQRAAVIVVGAPTHGRYAGLLDASVTQEITRRAHCDLHIVHLNGGPAAEAGRPGHAAGRGRPTTE